MGKNREREVKYNLHHICPSSRGGMTNDINCEMIKQTTHSAIHTLFSNEIFPEMIMRLTNLNWKALKPEVVKEIAEVLQERDIHNPEEWYKEDCLWIPKKRIYR